MSIQTLSSSTPTAKNKYPCHACLWLRESGIYKGVKTGLTFSELRAIAIAKSNNWCILKGEKYIKQNNIQDGDFFTYKAIPAIHEINIRMDMYSEC